MTDTIHNTILPMTDTAERRGLHREDGFYTVGKMPETQRSLFPGGQDLFRA